MQEPRLDVPIARIVLAIAALTIPPFAVADDTADGARPDVASAKGEVAQHGNASFYSKHLTGRKTASGERYDPNALTAAHRTLPLGTKLKVVNPKNDKSVVVTVNDRGPVRKNRVIDLSSAAADQLGMKRSGVTKVETQVVGKTPLQKTEGAETPSPH